jgi:serine/threonine-protein kinase
LKLMRPELVSSPRTRERFEQEARIASQVQSDHVVEVVAAGVDAESGAPWLAMELLEGETLEARVARTGPLPPAEVLEIARQLGHALGAAHAVGLVHRDIKPENIYLAAPRHQGVPFTLKVLDFGIAKLGEDVRASGGATGAVGSPLWMAPEQTSSAGVKPATDVWAMGLVMFYVLTGHSYWRTAHVEGGSITALLREIVMDPLEAASVRGQLLGVSTRIPPGFDTWFARAVAREPSERFADAAAALAALVPVLSGAAAMTQGTLPSVHAMSSPPMPRALSVTPERSGAGKWFLIGGALAVVVGIGLVVLASVAGLWFYELEPSASARAPVASASSSAVPVGGDAGAAVAIVAGAGVSAPPAAQTAPDTPAPKAAAAPVASAAAPAGEPPAQSAKPLEPEAPKRDYKFSWYQTKIRECWKGNEGAKPDAGSYSCSVTFTLSEMGQASKIIVSPRTYPKFAGCAVVRTSEHPWGSGPAETRSVSFSF